MNKPLIGIKAPSGAGGGDAPKPPTMTPDNIRSKSIGHIVEVISEGPCKGLVAGGQSIFLADTPLENPNGSSNFKNTEFYVGLGTPDQEPLQGFSDVETEISVGLSVDAYTNHLGAIHVIDGGSGYTTANVILTCTLGQSGDGTPKGGAVIPTSMPTATAIIAGGKITGFNITNPGAHIISNIGVTIVGDGTGAKAFAELAGGVTRTITNPLADAIRVKVRVNDFLEQTEKGDVKNTSVSFMIQIKEQNGVWKSPVLDKSYAPSGGPLTPITNGLKVIASLVSMFNKEEEYDLEAQYRLLGTSTWLSLGRLTGVTAKQATEQFLQWESEELNMGEYETRVLSHKGTATLDDTWYLERNATYRIAGKTSSGYEEAYRFRLPPTGYPWSVRILRMTSDPKLDRVRNRMQFAGYTEIINTRMTYANTAYVAMMVDSEYFSGGVPTRAYEFDGRIIRVPSNYDPIARTYSGIWDGTFKEEWSNNPAWVFLDMLTHERYGLGQWVEDNYIDVAQLYQIAQYCDEMVDDGAGGLEPRFTFNTQITAQEDAYNVLNNLASAFRGMIYWASGWVSFAQDAPAAVRRLVSPSNTIGGDFSYSGVARKARHSVAVVMFNDPENQDKKSPEIVEDQDLIARFGYITTKVDLVGCRSRGQAQRFGKWILDSEKFATQTVSYRAGWDHADCVPGEVIAVADPYYAGVRQGGRIKQRTTQCIQLDAPYMFDANETYYISLHLPTWGTVSVQNGSATVTGSRTKFTTPLKSLQAGDVLIIGNDPKQYVVQTVNGSTQLTLTTPWTGDTLSKQEWIVLRGGSIYLVSQNTTIDVQISGFDRSADYGGDDFLIDAYNPADAEPVTTQGEHGHDILVLATALPELPVEASGYIIVGTDVAPRQFRVISNKEIERGKFEITALEHDPTKYVRVEQDIILTSTPTYVDFNTQAEPALGITVTESLYRANNQVRSRILVSWEPSPDGRIDAYRLTYKFDGSEERTLLQTTETSAELIDAQPGDYQFSVYGLNALGATSDPVTTTFTALGKTAPPEQVTGFVAERTVNGVQLSWDEVDDLDVVGYEVRDGASWDTGEVITTQYNGTTLFVQLEDNTTHNFHIKALDELGNYSVTATSISASVQAPDNVTFFTALPDNDRMIFTWSKLSAPDLTYEIREGDSFDAGLTLGRFQGGDANVMYPVAGNKKFWIKAVSKLGLFSALATSAEVTVISIPNRNVIYEEDRVADGWAGGSNFNVVNDSGELTIAPGELEGYHIFEVNLSDVGRVRARCWFDSKLIVDAGSISWANATFTWNDPQAQNPWRPLAELGGARAEWEIAPDNPIPDAALVYMWPFNSNLTDIVTTKKPDTGTYSQDVGVVGLGYKSTDKVAPASYTGLAIPSTFTIMQEFSFDNVDGNFGVSGSREHEVELIRFAGVGKFLSLHLCRYPQSRFELRDGNDANLLYINWPASGALRVSIGIVQEAAARRLYLYDHDSTLSAQTSNSAPHVSGYDQLKV